jgi:HSP20 family molecular chaperone IbpA
MKRIQAFIVLSLAAMGLVQLSGKPLWDVVPQKKDLQEQQNMSLSEKEDRYVFKLAGPGRDLSQIIVKIQGGSLHVDAPNTEKLPALHKVVPLDGVTSDGDLFIERRGGRGLLTVIIPKEGMLQEASNSDLENSEEENSSEVITTYPGNNVAMMIGQMRRMQQQMDQMMGGMGFPSMGFPSMMSAIPTVRTPTMRMKAMPLLEDHGDRYVVRASLPGQDLSKVNVSINDRLLRIETNEESGSKSAGNSLMQHRSSYSQAMTLPGPVLVGKMKVDQKGNELMVTLPKATADNSQ